MYGKINPETQSENCRETSRKKKTPERSQKSGNRKNENPFGGVQIVLFGDVMQLAHVVNSDDKEVMEKFYPSGPFFLGFTSEDGFSSIKIRSRSY